MLPPCTGKVVAKLQKLTSESYCQLWKSQKVNLQSSFKVGNVEYSRLCLGPGYGCFQSISSVLPASSVLHYHKGKCPRFLFCPTNCTKAAHVNLDKLLPTLGKSKSQLSKVNSKLVKLNKLVQSWQS